MESKYNRNIQAIVALTTYKRVAIVFMITVLYTCRPELSISHGGTYAGNPFGATVYHLYCYRYTGVL